MLAKYFSTYTNRPTTSNSSTSHITNSLAENTVAEKNLATIEGDNVHFSDYLNDSDNENEDQSAPPNDHQRNTQNLGDTGDENAFVGGESDSDVELNRRLISDHEDEDAELMPT